MYVHHMYVKQCKSQTLYEIETYNHYFDVNGCESKQKLKAQPPTVIELIILIVHILYTASTI